MDDSRTTGAFDIVVDRTGRIEALVQPGTGPDTDRTVDVSGLLVIPGLVQAHVHLQHTLFRGLAEDLSHPRWQAERLWPLEAAHDAASLRAAARLGMAELLLGGTTAILDVGPARGADAIFEVAEEVGLRYTGGKALADAGSDLPAGLVEPTAAALHESDLLARRWHETAGGRLRYAYAVRATSTSSWDLLRSAAQHAHAGDMVVHTHAAEHPEESARVRTHFGQTDVELLVNLGVASPNGVLAHCVTVEPDDVDLLLSSGVSVAHCPSADLKLGAGIAPVPEYLERGINVALGAEGAAANNRLDTWSELRLAALLAHERTDAEPLTASDAFALATRGGAWALGLADEIGSIEPGKWADLAAVDLHTPHAHGPDDFYTQLVYSVHASDVRLVMVAGRVLVQDGRALYLDVDDILAGASRERGRLLERAAIRSAGALALRAP